MAKKAVVDLDTCIGCGACIAVAPSIFELNDDGLAVNFLGEDTELPNDLEDEAEEACAACPVIAISIK